jgi:hypothetical protein
VCIDDDMIEALAVGPVEGAPAGIADIVEGLVSWRTQVEARAIPELIGLESAVAAVLAAVASRQQRDLLAMRSTRPRARVLAGRPASGVRRSDSLLLDGRSPDRACPAGSLCDGCCGAGPGGRSGEAAGADAVGEATVLVPVRSAPSG